MGYWKAIQRCFYFLQILGSIPSIHLEWLVFVKLSGLIGYLLLDLVMFISYHLWTIGSESRRCSSLSETINGKQIPIFKDIYLGSVIIAKPRTDLGDNYCYPPQWEEKTRKTPHFPKETET